MNERRVRGGELARGARALMIAGVLGLLGLTTVACGPGQKGQSLLELEALREANYTGIIRTDPAEVENPRVQPVRQQAWGSIRESDEWYRAAVRAWENREGNESEEMARQGVLLYRTAEAYARAADARQQIENANLTYQTQLERRNRYNDMLAANEELIELLTGLRRLYDQTEDCRAELAGFSAEQEAEMRAEFAVGDARFMQRQAENRRANEWADQTYNQGVQLLSNAAEYVQARQYQLAFDTATLAATRFRESMEQTQSRFQDVQAGHLRSSGNQQLFDRAVSLFGDDASIDARGLVVVVRNLFLDRRNTIRDDRSEVLNQLAGLIRDGRRVSLTIEGHTSERGSREQNQTLSVDRAEAVREYLSNQGVRGSRVTVVGLGEDYPRYDNRTREGREDNNRVELVFHFD
jgi:outer membrane protein OmpA-like peptidoglycan-associated protein